MLAAAGIFWGELIESLRGPASARPELLTTKYATSETAEQGSEVRWNSAFRMRPIESVRGS